MINKDKYKPINCSYYDVLESHATIGDLIKITVMTEKDMTQTFSDRIINLETRKGEEFVKMESGNFYRLDAIVSINEESSNQAPFSTEC
jgi:Rho-binding antiterminator